MLIEKGKNAYFILVKLINGSSESLGMRTIRADSWEQAQAIMATKFSTPSTVVTFKFYPIEQLTALLELPTEEPKATYEQLAELLRAHGYTVTHNKIMEPVCPTETK